MTRHQHVDGIIRDFRLGWKAEIMSLIDSDRKKSEHNIQFEQKVRRDLFSSLQHEVLILHIPTPAPSVQLSNLQIANFV